MDYSISTQSLEETRTDCLVVAVPDGDDWPESTRLADAETNGLISELCRDGDFSAGIGTTELHVLRDHKNWKRLLLVGAGKPEKMTAVTFARMALGGASRIRETGATNALVAFADLKVQGRDQRWSAEVTARSFEQAFYRFTDFKSDKGKAPALKQVMVATESEDLQSALDRGKAVGEGMNVTRTLGNTPPNICHPTWLGEQAQKLSAEAPHIRTEILDEDAMTELGMGSLLAVSQGSSQPARLILMHYQGAGDPKEPPHILVGKGITFDTGGISLKPAASMDEMKYDMGGAASVLGTMTTVARLKPRANIIGVIAAAENMPSHNATRPGDIVTSLSGQTIEVINTDAEGRMVLCDALTYVERFNPATVVDMATLTGACIVALGHDTSAVMGNDDSVVNDLLASGEETGDRAWQLPLWDEYQSQLDSNFADMQNVGGKAAGTITAGCFLSRFTKAYPWAHIDIAGTAWVSGKEKGATGRPVPLLVNYLLRRSGSA